MIDDAPSVADIAIADSYRAPALATGKFRKELAAAMLQFRIDMRKANRFELDNDFVRMATAVAHRQPAAMLSRVGIATLPYETTWIEFSLHAKVQQSIDQETAAHPTLADVPERMGILLKRNTQRPTNWHASLVTEFALNGHKLTGIGPASYMFDANELLSTTGRNAYADSPERGAALAWGYHGTARVTAAFSAVQLAAVAKLLHHGVPTVHAAYGPMMNEQP